MINVFQIFKIILGVIISAFILFIVLRFAGSYTEIGESSRQVSIMVNFKKSMEDVYTTGISTDFEMKDLKIIAYRPPYIHADVSSVDMDPIPLFLVPGEKFSVYRNEYDLEWWKFYFIEVFPETKILFIPSGNDEKIWSVIGNMTKFLPSTENTETKVKFFLGCNKTDPVWLYPLGERNKFLDYWLPRFASVEFDILGPCEDVEKDYRVITVSEDESVDADFLVKPLDNGIGHVYIKNGDEQEVYVYKNGLDLVALLLGGKRYLDYLNGKFLKELEVGIDMGIRESNLLRGDMNMRRRCGTELSEFAGILGFIKEELIPKLDSMEEDDLREFNQYLMESSEMYKELNSVGCG
ncbi:MAG: hypothetical protein JSV39_02575 [Candidatus Aenigmatarchaeota archaeon]|nr:MAG: hypothetical protein JSV39_02575 [Candidatus Aenigmarchaeota archaeon]